MTAVPSGPSPEASRSVAERTPAGQVILDDRGRVLYAYRLTPNPSGTFTRRLLASHDYGDRYRPGRMLRPIRVYDATTLLHAAYGGPPTDELLRAAGEKAPPTGPWGPHG